MACVLSMRSARLTIPMPSSLSIRITVENRSCAGALQKDRAYYGRGFAYYERKEYIDADSDFTRAMYSNSSAGVSADAMRMHNNCVNTQFQEQMDLHQQQVQMIMSAPY